MFDASSVSINPINFFSIVSDCRSVNKRGDPPSTKAHKLPSTTLLTGERACADVSMGWHEEGLAFCIEVACQPQQSFYPAIDTGDAVELFIDTRDVKTSGFNTRFCHHFFFLPQAVEGISRGEKTHFRTEESHSLCDPQLLDCQLQAKKSSYHMQIFIPSQCLYGYDPKQFDRLGFTYRISLYGGRQQHFSAVSTDYQIEQQPSLWASLKLVK